MKFYGKSKQIAGVFAVCGILIVLGRLSLDTELAGFIKREIGLSFLRSKSIAGLPDILLCLVCAVTLFSWAAWFYLSLRPARRVDTEFFEYLGLALPLAFITKTVLKDVFGGTEARDWLLHPGQIQFHWFQGGGNFSGFPSGHMAVFTVLLLGIGRQFPRFRIHCLGLLIALALALMITEYHFLSDIAAGFSLGMMADVLVCRALPLLHRIAGLKACPSRSEGR